MFLIAKSRGLLERWNIESYKDIPAIDTTEIQSFQYEKESFLVIRLKSGVSFDTNKYTIDDIKMYNDNELEEVLKAFKEITYRVYQNELFAESIRDFDFSSLGLDETATEQERMKGICESGVYGIKPFSNLEYIRRW